MLSSVRKARSTPNVTSGSTKKDAPSTPEKAPPQASNEPSSPKSPVDPDVMDIITGVDDGGDDDPTLDGVDPKSLLNDEDAKLLESSNANLGGSSLVALGNISPEKKMKRSPSADSIETPPLSNTSGTSGGGVKAASVSFALSSPSSSPKSSSKDKEDDEKKSREELLETIGKVREEYSKMKIDYSAEKALRKKKERNLVKLAKQLNLRSTEIEEKNKMVDQLVKTSAELETKLDSTKRSLDTLSTQHTNTNRSHHTEITSAQNQYRDTCAKYDARIAELTSNHDRQCEELRRQILGISLEADRLRMQVASHEMRKNPSRAERVVARTLLESSIVQSRGLSFRKRRDDRWDLKIIIIYGMVFLLTGGLAWAHTKKLLSIDAMCGPCMPGTELNDDVEPATFEAPWWVAPTSVKPKAFNMLCGSRPRTVLDWSVGPVGKTNRLVVTDVGGSSGDDDSEGLTPPPLLDIKTKLKSVIVESGQDMSTTTMRGKVSEFQTPWMMMVEENEESS